MYNPWLGLTPTTTDLLALILGDRLGTGVDRDVFVFAYDPKMVVKVCHGQYDYQNIAEYTLWNAADEKLSKWLAPVHRISPDGRVLIQERCEICPASLMPKRVPQCLAEDFHKGNIGWLDGRPVCIDYGRHTALRMAANAKVMTDAHRLADTEERRSW